MINSKQGKERIRIIFGALGDPSRFKIFKLIAQKSGFCVTEIASALKISAPAVSQQFRILEMAGLVERERKGQMICYQIKKNDPVVRSILKIIN